MGINQLIMSSGHSFSHNSYLGGNAFEALVGALYLDRGYDACMKFMKKRILAQMINIDKVAYKEVNFKSKLIEWSQKNRVKLSFELVTQSKDKNGSPIFSYQVVIEGVEGCTGKGFSKKESQQQASKLTLEKLKKEPQFIDAVFEAKGKRTKMEEEPVNLVPDTEEKMDFIIPQGGVQQPQEEEKHVTAFKEKVYSENSQPQSGNAAADSRKTADDENEEFDLSDISAQPQSREEIIAAAEEQAFKE